jgi:hypothetical protein
MSQALKIKIAALTTVLFVAGLSTAGLATRTDTTAPPAEPARTRTAQPAPEAPATGSIVPAGQARPASLEYDDEEYGEDEGEYEYEEGEE